jgi:hypothetical protein
MRIRVLFSAGDSAEKGALVSLIGHKVSILGVLAAGIMAALAYLGVFHHGRGTTGASGAHAAVPNEATTKPVRTYPDPRGTTKGARLLIDRSVIDAGIFEIMAAATGRVDRPASLAAWREAIGSRVVNALAQQKARAIREGLDVAQPSLSEAASLSLLKDRSFIHFYEGDFQAATKTLRTALEVSKRAGASLDDQAEIRALLGLAALRRGELENCVACVGPSSCIFPIEPAAVHKNPAGSREAVEHFLAYLKLRPGDLRIQWLLNLAYMTLGEYPDKVPTEYLIPLDAFRSTAQLPRFPNVATEVGLTARGPAESGGSVFDDFTGDGRPDIFLSTMDIDRGATLWVNRGDGTFEDATARAGLDKQCYALNLRAADYDNDGDLDVLLMRGAWETAMPLTLLRNDGTGVFEDVTIAAGLDLPIASESAAWGDYDNDGLLDLYVCGEFKPARPDSRNLCRLYHNEGNGRFVDVAKQAGVENARYAKGAAWGDVDNDGRLDLFVSNMTAGEWMACRLYHNQGNGQFVDMATPLGLGSPALYFSCTFWDFDNDGWQDLFVSNFNDQLADVVASYLGVRTETVGHPGVFKNIHGTVFREVSAEVGLDRPIPNMSLATGDLDNDGWPDLHFGTGWMSYSGLWPNLTFLNQNGRHFADVTESSRTGHLQKGHGIAMVDYDGDGDLDLFSTFGGGYPGDRGYNALFKNPGNTNHWLQLKLEGRKTNRSAIGVRIQVHARHADGSSATIHQTVGNNGSFAGNPFEQHFGLGDATTIEKVIVEWPTSGTTQVFENVGIDRRYHIIEGGAIEPSQN